MPSDVIQWFPGHMAKTRRMMRENLTQVDLVIEVLDARIPYSSRNPEIKKIILDKPLLTVLNKADLADEKMNKEWCNYFSQKNNGCILIDCASGNGISKIPNAVKELLSDKLERYNDKGMLGKKLKAMIVGIPNVGKSSLINKLSDSKKAKVENRPGVTLEKQWVSTDLGIDLMDMPGILWPKFEDRTVGENLAITGAIKDKILDIEEIAMLLCGRLQELYPELLIARYKLNESDLELDSYDLFETIGKKRGMLMSGGVINSTRTAEMLLNEFRSSAIGRITLEKPKS
ncbi:MAG: ribosome biogenesis GTPase YlqF [Ruminococcaceae bacterium]|nr:ribosome biogenesis GTPase YlqF [Oscillospiraceae bacterium]